MLHGNFVIISSFIVLKIIFGSFISKAVYVFSNYTLSHFIWDHVTSWNYWLS